MNWPLRSSVEGIVTACESPYWPVSGWRRVHNVECSSLALRLSTDEKCCPPITALALVHCLSDASFGARGVCHRASHFLAPLGQRLAHYV